MNEKLLINDNKSNNSEIKSNNEIEELARDIFEPKVAIDGIDIAFAAVHGADSNSDIHFMRIARHLYSKGYRKQTDTNVGSKWISVKDRLPTHEDGKVLICTAYGISIAQKTTTNHWKGDNAIPKLITHWMPLPEAPKEE